MALKLKTGQAKLWVLLVGVSQYDDRRFPLLQYSKIDAQQLADAFADVTQEFPQVSIKLHHDSATAPTLTEVRSSLQEIVEQAKPEDTVVFYFCGHGALDPHLQQVVLCLADTQKDAMLKTGLSAIGLLGGLRNCAAKEQVLWIDVNHANGMLPQTDSPEMLDNPVGQLLQMFQQQASQNPEFQAMLACDAPSRRDRAQQSWKFPELGHGIFSHFLIEGLRGAAASPQGIVTASVLANFVRDRTVQYIDRTNQQLEWLHRDTEDNTPKAISQTPTAISHAQTQTVIGIKPTDPLELLFPNIKATNIQPPLDRSASLRKPEPESITTEPIQKVSEPSIEPSEIKPIVQDVISPPPQPIIPKVEPVVPIVQKAISEPVKPIVPEIKPSSPAIQEIVSQPVKPVVSEPIKPVVPKVEPVVPIVQEAISEPVKPIVVEIQPIVPTVQKVVSPPVQPTVSDIKPIVQKGVPEPAKPTVPKVESVVPPIQPIVSEPISEPIVEPISEPIVERSIQSPVAVPEPVRPAPRDRSRTQRQIKRQLQRFRRSTNQQLQQAAITITQAKQTAGEFAIAQHRQSQHFIAQLRQTLTIKLHHLNRSVHHSANSGQALYRQHTSRANHLATEAAQRLDRSTRTLTQSTIEQAQKPQTRQQINTGLKILGVVAVGVAGVGFYQYRNSQIHAVQQLSSAAASQFEANQPGAFSTAIEAGRKLQQIDQPWNFVPESLRVSTIATLQQAIEGASSPTSMIGASLSNATISPDQKTFAVSAPDHSIQLWQRQGDTFKPRGTAFKGHQGAITQLVFSPDGKRLASGSVDKTIKLWDVEKGILIQTLSAHTQAITALSFRSDSAVLASGSADQTIKLWTVATGRILDTFKGHNAIASVIRFSPDNRILAAGTTTNKVYLWYPDSQNPILLGSHGSGAAQSVRTAESTKGINDLAFSPDGKTIA
ncbi:MAG TPA: hypothetical protein VL134_11790, partial [Leptolyngbya sp.]|nr:hypothetical protein [Leptolyngbya sp.]